MKSLFRTINTKTYSLGFGLSLAVTLVAWQLVHYHVQRNHLFWTDKALVITILCLAVVQLFIQLIFFLHLFNEKGPRWNLMVFSFMAIVLVILIGGSLWIMYNLDYHHPHHPSPRESNGFIIHDEGIKP
jgi:cytochrome o ubiquinol oxidase subunit IV